MSRDIRFPHIADGSNAGVTVNGEPKRIDVAEVRRIRTQPQQPESPEFAIAGFRDQPKNEPGKRSKHGSNPK